MRWRQLVEIVARAPDASSRLAAEALAEIRSETPRIDEQLRAATARAVASPRLPVELVAAFVDDSLSVAAPVLAAASLRREQWNQLLDHAPDEIRRFVTTLHPELRASERASPPAPVEPAEHAIAAAVREAPPPEQGDAAEHIPSISEVVARIERLRQERQRPEATAPEPAQSAPPGAPRLFRWECRASGEIAWVEGAPRGALIGRSIAQPGDEVLDERIQRAFAMRIPFRDAPMRIASEGLLAGEWRLSGVPAFEPADGRFAGYRGIATRSADEGRRAAVLETDDHSLRELVHEMKTPLNAIIGFAEIIDGQYLGPADHAYRDRASEIVAQARLLLVAIEDLDLAARLRAAPQQASGSSDLEQVVETVWNEIRERAEARGAVVELSARGPIPITVATDLAERLVQRFCTAVVDGCGRGERLHVRVLPERSHAAVMIDRPKGLSDQALGGESADGFASVSGLSLRLAGALATLAGGDIKIEPARLKLTLPAKNVDLPQPRPAR